MNWPCRNPGQIHLADARYKNVATPKQRDMRAWMRLFGCLASPLQRPIDDKFKISAAANSGYAIGFSVSRSSRGSVRLQMTTKFGVADELVLC